MKYLKLLALALFPLALITPTQTLAQTVAPTPPATRPQPQTLEDMLKEVHSILYETADQTPEDYAKAHALLLKARPLWEKLSLEDRKKSSIKVEEEVALYLFYFKKNEKSAIQANSLALADFKTTGYELKDKGGHKISFQVPNAGAPNTSELKQYGLLRLRQGLFEYSHGNKLAPVTAATQVWAEIIFAVQNNVEIAFGMDDFGLFLAAQKNIFLAYFALRENPKLVEQAGGYTHTDIKDIFDKLIRPDLEHNIFAGQFLALADAVFSPRGSAEEEKLLSCVNNLKDALKEPAVCEEHQQSRERSYYTNAVQANYYLWLKRSAELAEAKTDDDKKAIQADMDRFKAELRELTTSELGTTKRPLGPRFMFEEILVEKILK